MIAFHSLYTEYRMILFQILPELTDFVVICDFCLSCNIHFLCFQVVDEVEEISAEQLRKLENKLNEKSGD